MGAKEITIHHGEKGGNKDYIQLNCSEFAIYMDQFRNIFFSNVLVISQYILSKIKSPP